MPLNEDVVEFIPLSEMAFQSCPARSISVANRMVLPVNVTGLSRLLSSESPARSSAESSVNVSASGFASYQLVSAVPSQVSTVPSACAMAGEKNATAASARAHASVAVRRANLTGGG